MKKTILLSGVVAAAVLSGTSAMAQISYANGDLLAAFGKSGSSVDLVVDLGSISQYQSKNASTINLSSISTALTSVFGGTSGVYWATFGVNDTSGASGAYDATVTQADANTIWTSMPGSTPSTPKVGGSSASQAYVLGDIQTIASLSENSTYASSTGLSGNMAEVSTGSELDGFTPQLASGGNFNGDWRYNILNTGATSSYLYQSDPGNAFTDKQTLLGTFTLTDSAFTYTAVPEPSSVALVAGGLAGLALIRRRVKK